MMKTTTRNTSNYAKERDEAMLSLDEKKIRDFCRKHNVSVSDNPIVFWGGVYKTVLAITSCPPEIRKKAEDWLDSHGFHRGITGSPAAPSRPERYPRHTFEHVILPGAMNYPGASPQAHVVAPDLFEVLLTPCTCLALARPRKFASGVSVFLSLPLHNIRKAQLSLR